MEYDTFAEANSHTRRSARHVVNLVRNRVDSSPTFTFFLGAGASITSGVRGAASLKEEWRRIRFAATAPTDRYESWLRKQDWFGAEDEYSQLFELVYDQPSQRRAFIENVVKGARPSWGYAYLTSLIERGVVNTVFTTNFDDLINEACFLFGNQLRPLVCAHDSAVSSIRLMSNRPKVVKLHGDFLYDSIKNTSAELANLEANMRDKVIEFAREFGMIVVGYSGADKSVMDVFTMLARTPSYFRSGLYWCVRKGTTPAPMVRQLLRYERVYWVEIDGFDELMAELASGDALALPLGVTAPHQVALSRSGHLLESAAGTSHPRISHDKGDVAEVHRRVRTALEQAGLFDSTRLSQRSSMAEVTGEFEAFTLPVLQVQNAIERKDFAKAEEILRRLLDGAKLDRRWGVLRRLLDCILDSGYRANDIIALLTENEGLHGTSDDLACGAYYALFANESSMALRYAERALELNPGSSRALVNKALSHLQVGELSIVAELGETLTAGRMQNRYRAAGYALTGRFEQMASALQCACALKEYTPREALQDVAFRPYWELQQFLKVLEPFVDEGRAISSRRAHYPMTECERQLHERVREPLMKVVAAAV
jgi:NAD-dependent SIR2 family protein deacetylase